MLGGPSFVVDPLLCMQKFPVQTLASPAQDLQVEPYPKTLESCIKDVACPCGIMNWAVPLILFHKETVVLDTIK